MQQSNGGDNPQAKVLEIEKAWLAGLIDGEGSIRIDFPNGRTSASPRIVITNNDWAIIEKAQDICYRLRCNPHISQRKGKRSDTKDILILGMQKIMTLIPEIINYLTGSKEHQASMLYDFCELRKSINVNALPNKDRGYSEKEILLIHRIKRAKHSNTSLRDYTLERTKRKV